MHLQTHHPLKIKINGEHKNPTSSKIEDETKTQRQNYVETKSPQSDDGVIFLTLNMNIEPRITNREPRISNHELRTTNYELRTTNIEPQITNCEFKNFGIWEAERRTTD